MLEIDDGYIYMRVGRLVVYAKNTRHVMTTYIERSRGVMMGAWFVRVVWT